MNPTVEETFFGAFLDKNPDSTDVHITPEMMNVHITPEMMTDRNITYEFLKYAPSFTSSMKLKFANLLGVKYSLLHLRRKQ